MRLIGRAFLAGLGAAAGVAVAAAGVLWAAQPIHVQCGRAHGPLERCPDGPRAGLLGIIDRLPR